MRRLLLLVLAVSLVVGVIPALAQQVANSKSGLVQYIEGEVYLDEKVVPEPLVAKFPYLEEGGVLRTTEGRAEIIMNPGLTLRVGENATVKMVTNRFIDTRVELVKGSAVVQYLETLKDNAFTVVCGQATISIDKPGDFHFSADPPQLKVYAGTATAKIGDESYEITSGKMLNFGGATASVEKFNKDETDALDRWSARRGELMAAANASSAKEVYLANGAKNPCYSRRTFVSNGADPCVGVWKYNPWYGFYTYIPYSNQYCDPYWGYCLYNPVRVMTYVYAPPPTMPSGGGWNSQGGYATIPQSSGGYSGASSAASTASYSSPSAGSGASATSSAAATSSGRGSSSGGGHGK